MNGRKDVISLGYRSPDMPPPFWWQSKHCAAIRSNDLNRTRLPTVRRYPWTSLQRFRSMVLNAGMESPTWTRTRKYNFNHIRRKESSMRHTGFANPGTWEQVLVPEPGISQFILWARYRRGSYQLRLGKRGRYGWMPDLKVPGEYDLEAA